MGFEFSSRSLEYHRRITAFMNEFVYPNEDLYRQQVDGAADRWSAVPIVEDLKAKAKAEGLWNLFLAGSELGPGLSNLDYAPLARSEEHPSELQSLMRLSYAVFRLTKKHT